MKGSGGKTMTAFNWTKHSAHSGNTQRFTLPGKQAQTIRTNKVKTLRIEAGCAWISYDGKDYLIKAGETLTLPVSHYPAVISSADRRRVAYSVL
jgi:hypothetical protein